MLRQSFANPSIFTLFCADNDYEVVPSGVIRVQEIRDDS